MHCSKGKYDCTAAACALYEYNSCMIILRNIISIQPVFLTLYRSVFKTSVKIFHETNSMLAEPEA
jgi:hypothetical protein